METKKLKLNVGSTKALYKATIDFLQEVNGERDMTKLEEALMVWVSATELMDCVIQEFLSITDSDERHAFLTSFIGGIEMLPDELDQADIIPRGMYNKNNLPQA